MPNFAPAHPTTAELRGMTIEINGKAPYECTRTPIGCSRQYPGLKSKACKLYSAS